MTASLQQRILHTFAAPTRLGRELRESTPPWADVLLLVVVVGIVSVMAVPDEFFLQEASEAVDRRGRPVEITSDPATIVRWGRMLGMFAALAQWPILVLALAGVLALVFNVIGRREVHFRQYLALSAHAFLILAVQQLVLLLVAALAGREAVPGSLADLLPQLQVGSVAHALLDVLNPFAIWMLAVAGAALGALAPRLTPRGAATVLVGGYLVVATALALATR